MYRMKICRDHTQSAFIRMILNTKCVQTFYIKRKKGSYETKKTKKTAFFLKNAKILKKYLKISKILIFPKKGQNI